MIKQAIQNVQEAKDQYLTFKITDSALYGGRYQYLLDDDMKLPVYMEKDMSNSWKSQKKLNKKDLEELKKEIEKQLPNDFKSGTYEFGTRTY